MEMVRKVKGLIAVVTFVAGTFTGFVMNQEWTSAETIEQFVNEQDNKMDWNHVKQAVDRNYTLIDNHGAKRIPLRQYDMSAKALFDKADTNHNGKLEKTELDAGSARRLLNLMAAPD